MESLLTPSNITFAVGLGGVVFSIFLYFKNPQVESDKRDALLAQQFKFMNDSIETRFRTVDENFKGLLLQSNNHIHTVDTKVDKSIEAMTGMGRELTRLATIIEERIPKK